MIALILYQSKFQKNKTFLSKLSFLHARMIIYNFFTKIKKKAQNNIQNPSITEKNRSIKSAKFLYQSIWWINDIPQWFMTANISVNILCVSFECPPPNEKSIQHFDILCQKNLSNISGTILQSTHFYSSNWQPTPLNYTWFVLCSLK